MTRQQVYKGHPIAPGIALGPAFLIRRERQEVPLRRISRNQVSFELEKLDLAISMARRDLRHHRMKAMRTLGDIVARIFDAHLMFLEDEPTFDSIRDIVRNETVSADYAVYHTLENVARNFEAQKEDVFRDRAQDVRDVMGRVIAYLDGTDTGLIGQITGPSVLIAQELNPSDVMQLDPEMVLGVATCTGGTTSHTAILTASLGVPSVIGVPEILDAAQLGDLIAINGNSGKVVVRPNAVQIDKYREKQNQYRTFVQSLRNIRDTLAMTRDGHRVGLMANIELPHEAERVALFGGEGVGLYRTEYLVPAQAGLPNETTQEKEYRRVVEALRGKPLVIRTFDLGGDKAFPGSGIPPQANPFMGWRAVRVAMDRPEMLIPQLRAILRVASTGPVSIMFPMISNLDELLKLKDLLEKAKQELRSEHVHIPEPVSLGIMVEVPAVAMLADRFAPHVDFFSIGTNDLAQFALAVDRSNDHVAELHDPFNPAVLQLISTTVLAGRKHGLKVSLCGELAGNPLATLLLVGLGLDELSMSPALIPEIKKLILSATWEESRDLAGRALEADTGAQVRDLLLRAMRRRFRDMPIWFGDR
ncbi:MAG: phosphoenolpyruvate--protein phosphotransferase [bacterium]